MPLLAQRYDNVEQIAELPPGNYLVEDAPDDWVGYRKTEDGWLAVGSEKIESDADMIGIAIAGPLEDPEMA